MSAGSAHVDNFTFEGNITFDNPSANLSANTKDPQKGMKNLRIIDNCTYRRPGENGKTHAAFGYYNDVVNDDITMTGNYFVIGSDDDRLYALDGTQPPKPGLIRTAPGEGAAIEVEVWALSVEAFGRFVAAVPSPLSIGTVVLGDGRRVKGFLVEAQAVAGARDVSSFGGWRAFKAQR